MEGTVRRSSVYFATVSTDEDIGGTGDFNGDGKDDILFQNTTTGARTIWLMNGTVPGAMVSLGTIHTTVDRKLLVGSCSPKRNSSSISLRREEPGAGTLATELSTG